MARSQRPSLAALTTAAALAVVSALTLAACSDASDSGADPSASPAPTASDGPPPVPVGLEWTAIPRPTTTNPELNYMDVTAAGAYWLVATKDPTNLHVTRDGETWQAIDLTAHGLPAEAQIAAGTGGCNLDVTLDDRGDAVTFVYYAYTGGSHPAGLANVPWLVDVAGDQVTVTRGADVGLENMPARQGDDDFRTDCAEDFVELGGQRMLVGEGQWWQPYRTSEFDAFTATEGADGTWEVYSTKESPFLGGSVTVNLAGAEVVGGQLVAVLDQAYDTPGFTAWFSPDGRAWEQAALEFAPGLKVVVDDVTVTDSGLVVLSHVDEGTPGTAFLWHTPDGRTWTSLELGGGDFFQDGVVVPVPGGYLATAEYTVDGSTDVYAWFSADGLTWEPFEPEADLRPQLLDARPLGEGLIMQAYGGDLYVSGKPWG